MRVAEISWRCTFVVLGFVVTAAAVAGPPIPRSMYCRQFIEQPDGMLTGPLQLWAEGNNMHGVMLYEGRLIHTLQLGDTLFTWVDGDREGRRRHLGNGLASYGLIRQIERIHSLGTWDRQMTVAGAVYEQYRYTGTAQTDGERMTMIFRDAEVNITLPDGVFDLPDRVVFAESK